MLVFQFLNILWNSFLCKVFKGSMLVIKNIIDYLYVS